MAIKLLSLVMLIPTAACVSGEQSPDKREDWRSGGKADGETCDFSGMSATRYYDLFSYKSDVVDKDTWYQVGATWDRKAVLENGSKVGLDAYFLPDDRMIIDYQEEVPTSNGTELHNQSVIVTHRHIDNADPMRTIVIDGLGSGTPYTRVNDRGGCSAGIDFKMLTTDIRTAGMRGDETQLTTSWTTGFVIDPDHLDQVPDADARKWFEEDVASGKIKIVRF